jgi:type I restriction enzyme S subunit
VSEGKEAARLPAGKAGAGGARRYKPYPAYKDSGVEWLGEIPAHWEVKRLKTFAAVQLSNVDKKSVEGQEPVRLCNYTDVYYNERITADLDFMAATATREQAQRFALRAGDVLITKDSESWTDIAVPAVVSENLPDVLCGYHLAHIRPAGGAVGAFLSRAFSAIGPRDQFQVAANGITRFGLGGDAIRTGLFAMPPEPEQRAIAAFLDRETARIDALVAKKERLITLLEEQRTALITRAVTKGLDPTVPMKDSGVEWLGEIPAHWEVKPIRALARPGYKTFTDGDWIESPFIRDEGIRLIQTGNVGVGEYKEQGFRYIDGDTFRAFRCTEVLPGDVLICRLADPVGRACLAPDLGCRMITSVDVCILKPAQDIDPAFVVYALSGSEYLAWLGGICRGGTRDRVSRSMLGAIRVQKPPLPEQRAIAAFLDRETSRIDALVAKVREAIERLKELRTALISAAVTGKIDVREEVA